MEIREEQLNIIYELVSRGIASRNLILDELAEKDELFKNVLNLRRAEKDEIEIAKQLQISVEDTRSIIENIEQVSQKIDGVIAVKHNKDHERNKSDKFKNEAHKMQAKTRKSLYQKQIKEFLSRYMLAKDNGTLDKMNLAENVKKFEAKLNYIGERVSYKLYLAEMYLYLEKFNKVREILSWYELENLTDMEKRQYKNIEKDIIIQENKKLIQRLCDKGKSYQEILDECEKVGTGNRIYLKPKFIKETMNDYLNKEDKKDKDEKER